MQREGSATRQPPPAEQHAGPRQAGASQPARGPRTDRSRSPTQAIILTDRGSKKPERREGSPSRTAGDCRRTAATRSRIERQDLMHRENPIGFQPPMRDTRAGLASTEVPPMKDRLLPGRKPKPPPRSAFMHRPFVRHGPPSRAAPGSTALIRVICVHRPLSAIPPFFSPPRRRSHDSGRRRDICPHEQGNRQCAVTR